MGCSITVVAVISLTTNQAQYVLTFQYIPLYFHDESNIAALRDFILILCILTPTLVVSTEKKIPPLSSSDTEGDEMSTTAETLSLHNDNHMDDTSISEFTTQQVTSECDMCSVVNTL